MKKYIIFALSLFLFYSYSTYSQNLYDYDFKKDFSIHVTDSNGRVLLLPWTGGLNSIQFSEIDLNLDGTKDLFAFDKTGANVYTFINQGIADSVCYVYDYSYEKYFPKFYGWVTLRDYNHDNKEDIFCYTPAGIKVYKNISDTILKFRMIHPMLNSDMGGSISNIGLTEDDFPGIGDIDGDGDLDILNFFGLGTFIMMHKNLSQEIYGNSDTLLFKRTFYCWGDIAESSSNNQLYLNTPCPWQKEDENKGTRHTGCTMLLCNFNNDSLTDLVLGDVDFFDLTLLINGGTRDSAHIVQKDTLFPLIQKPIHINSFPVLSLLDVNNDTKADLLASPFTSMYTSPENSNSIWYYKNEGTAQQPVFQFKKQDFLQDKMIDLGGGAYPVIVDFNGDTLPDIVVGNFGYLDSAYYQFGSLKTKMRSQLAYFENVGSAGFPKFIAKTYNYGNLSLLKQQALTPTFGDLDNDLDLDMICGNITGSLIYFENTAGIGNLPVYAAPVFDYQGVDVDSYSAPQLFDLTGDTKLDLVVGNRAGRLTYYENTGSATIPVFTKITDTLGGVSTVDFSVSSYGHCIPNFFIDSGIIKLFVGSVSGNVYYYKDIQANLGNDFTCEDTLLIYKHKDSSSMIINDGIHCAPAVYDFNFDGYPDMVLGNFSGGLTFYWGTKPFSYINMDEQALTEEITFELFPNPASSMVRIGCNDTFLNRASIQIFDITGRLVLQKKLQTAADYSIDVASLPGGIYTCALVSANNTNFVRAAKKLVIY